MAKFKIRLISGGGGGFILGGGHFLYEIQEASKNLKPKSQYYVYTAVGSSVGIKAGGYGISQWTEFDASCNLKDFHGYVILSSIQVGPAGANKLSFNSGPAAGIEILGYGWGISTDASISFLHGWMRMGD